MHKSSGTRTLPAVSIAGLMLFGTAAPGAAYSKFEHEQLTYYAFKLARQLSCETGPEQLRPAACAGFFEVPPTELGVVTRAVDYFSNPARLAPVAAACTGSSPIDPDSEDFGCRKSMREKCADLSDPSCLDCALEDTLERVRNRRSNRLYRALAVHRNDEHFRQGARDEYNRMHDRALRFARDGRYGLALVAEAIAIHFLQDGFSPGHLAAPRDQYGDSHAGALHDRANGLGLEMWVGTRVCQMACELKTPLEALWGSADGATPETDYKYVIMKRQPQTGQITGSEKAAQSCPVVDDDRERKSRKARKKTEQLPVAKQIPPDRLKEDLELFTGDYCSPSPSPREPDRQPGLCESSPRYYDAYGDKRLLEGRPKAAQPDPESTHPGEETLSSDEAVSKPATTKKPVSRKAMSKASHRISLLALTALSIQDVLEAEHADRPLRICFHPPSVVSQADHEVSDTRDRYWAPGLAIGRHPERWPDSRLCWRRRPSAGERRADELIYGYRTEPIERRLAVDYPGGATRPISPQERSEARYDLRVGVHRVNGIQLALSYWGDRRRRFEVGQDVLATEKYWRRSKDGTLSGGTVGRKAVATTGWVLHYEKEGELEVQGGGFTIATGTQLKDFDVYAAVEPGIGHYRHPSGDTTRFRWSARVGLGLSVVALEGILERGLEESGAGGLERAWKPSVNLRFRIAPSWLKLLFGKLGKD